MSNRNATATLASSLFSTTSNSSLASQLRRDQLAIFEVSARQRGLLCAAGLTVRIHQWKIVVLVIDDHYLLNARRRMMRLEYLCDMELVFQEMPEWPAKFLLIRPYGGEEGAGYGEGTGTVTGPRLQGRMRWVNHPHRRSDGAMLPDVHGVVHTEDGATVMFSLQGRTFFDGDTGKQLLLTLFEAEDERYQWLNSALCVLEGLIDAERLVMRARVFACQHELE